MPGPSPPISYKPAHRRTQTSLFPETSRESSVQKIWEQDYFADESTSLGDISLPPPATLTSRPFPRSVPLSEGEESYPARQPRTHQRSLTEYLPFTIRTESASPKRSRSPIKDISTKDVQDEFMPTLTGDKDRTIKLADRSRGLASWFSGASAPVQLGLPIMDRDSPASIAGRNDSYEQSPTKSQRGPPAFTTPSSTGTPSRIADTANSMFGSFFLSPKTPSKGRPLPKSLNLEDDEFVNLDFQSALFPNGPANPHSPSSFNNLLVNAEGLLLRLQTAYKLRTLSLQEVQAEKEAQAEEYEEATIRAQSLKSQLEDLSNRLVDQETTISTLTSELLSERKARAEEKETRERSITLIKSHCSSYGSKASSLDDQPSHKHNSRKWRESYASTDISEAEDGVFSRSDSPSPTLDSTASAISSMYAQSNSSITEIGQATVARMIVNPNQKGAFSTSGSQAPQNQNQDATKQSQFHKMLKSTFSSPTKDFPTRERGLGEGADAEEQRCDNCLEKDVSFAWDTVGLLKVENRALKERVGVLEEGVESALDAVLGGGR